MNPEWKPGDKAYCSGSFSHGQMTYEKFVKDRRDIDIVANFPQHGYTYVVERIEGNSLFLRGVSMKANGIELGWDQSAFKRIIPTSERPKYPKKLQDDILDLYLQGKITQEEMQQKMLDIENKYNVNVNS